MLKNGLLFIAMAFLVSDQAFSLASFSNDDTEIRWPDVAVVDEGSPSRILGMAVFSKEQCSKTIRTQASIWGDSSLKSPLSPRSRLGLGVGLQEKAQDLWNRRCFDEAARFYEKAAEAYQEVIQLSAGDPSPVQRTFRLQASMNMATIYIQVGAYDAARSVLNMTLSERDAYLPAITRLAEVELRSGQPQLALAITERLRNKPYEDIGVLSVGQFWAVRADAHCQLGYIEEANKEIKIARRADPNVREAQCR